MTPLPKRRHSKARQGKREKAKELKFLSLSPCKNCGTLKNPHTICPNCGFYGGVEVLPPKIKKPKTNEKPD